MNVIMIVLLMISFESRDSSFHSHKRILTPAQGIFSPQFPTQRVAGTVIKFCFR